MTMDQQCIAREMLARRAGLYFLRGLNDMARKLPHPDGAAIRITATLIDSGEDLGTVDVDATNADDVGAIALRRADQFRGKSTRAGKPALYLVGGGQ